MKFLVLIFLLTFKEQQQVLSQFQLPGFSNQGYQFTTPGSAPFQIPFNIGPPGFQIPTPASIPSGPVQSFLSQLQDQVNGARENNYLQFFQELFNPTSPSFFPANPVTSLIQKFQEILFNSSSLSNPFLSDFRTINTSIDYNSIPEPIRKSLESAFAQFHKSVNRSFNQGLERIQNSFEKLNKTANSAIEFVENSVATGLQDINNTISRYNETVQNCFYDKASYYEAIIPNAGDEAKDCVRKKISEVENIIGAGQANIVEAIEGAQNLTTTIQSCSSEEAQEYNYFGAIGCYILSLLNVHSETVFLPLQITRRFTEIDMSITSSRADVIACTSTVSETIAQQSLNVTGIIADCLIIK